MNIISKTLGYLIYVAAFAALSAAAGCVANEQPLPGETEDGYRIALQIEPGTTTKAEVDGILGKTFWNTKAPFDSVLVVTNETGSNGKRILYKAAVKDVKDGTGYITLSRKGSGSAPAIKSIVYPSDFTYLDAWGDITEALRTEYKLEEVSGMTSRVVLIADMSTYPASKTITMWHQCGLLRLKLTGIPAGTASVSLHSLSGWIAGRRLSREGTDGDGKHYISYAQDDGYGKSRTVKIIMPANYAGGDVTVNIPLPHGSFDSFEVSALDASGGILASAHADGLGWEIERREGKKLTLDMADGMDGLVWDLPAVTAAEFSVSPYNKVRFTTSNLMYAGKTARAMGQSTPWRLMKYPWSMVEKDDWDAAQCSVMGDISLFGWGTSGYNGINPWTCSDIDDDYGPVVPGTLAPDYDWGRYNRVYEANGSSELPGLRLLTREEWEYLLFSTSRPNRFAYATVCGVKGLLLFPDDYIPTGVSSINDSSVQMDYTANILSRDAFQLLAEDGVVFLPAAGSRDEEGAFYAGTPSGNYWTSTCKSNINDANVPVYLLIEIVYDETDPASPIYADGLIRLDEAEPIDGYSVRLIHDKNLEPQAPYNPFTPETWPFSVADGKKVLFTTSNLTYDGSQASSPWRLQQHPWDLVEQSNWTQAQRDGQGRISLFAWGTSGYNGRNPWLQKKLESSDQNWSWETENDWGRYNSIWTWDGSTSYSELRVLSKDEWDFLLNGESRGETRYAKAVVNGICGLLIFPDNYSRGGIVNANSQNSSFADNIFTAEEFFTLSLYGVTFLPSAGSVEYNTDINSVQYLEDIEVRPGIYWSSSNSSLAYCASGLIFSEEVVGTDDECYYTEGYSVRLVKDMEIPVSRITLEQGANLKMPVYESVQLTASVYPAQATDKTLIWGSEDENVASVDLTSGLLTAKGLGKTTIYCTNEASSVFATIDITVAYEPINQKGVFSVSPTKKVRFTSANLMYAGSTGTSSTRWRIMEFPWSMTAYAAGTVPSASSGYDVDLLPATSPYPWSNGIYDPEGEELLSGLSLLSETEWRYLLKQSDAIGDSFQNDEGRTDPIRFVEAKVNGVQGLIIFPDGFTSEKLYYIGGTSGSSKISQLWNLNVLRSSLNWNQGDGSGIYTLSCPEFSITDSQFHELAYQGAVFIPAAGYAQGGILTAREDVSSVSSMGPYVEGRGYFYYTNNPAYPFNWMIYWTSTGGTAASQAKVMNLCYRSAGSNSSPTYSYTEADRSLQRSVRLVQEVQN